MSFITQNAAEYVPQKPPFVFVDKILFVDDSRCLCSFTAGSENIFLKNGYYSTSGMVESMAQTAAAGTGYLSKKENKGVRIGYIGAVQKLEVLEWPPANTEFTMEIKLLTNILQVSLVSAVVKMADRIMASCEMKIFIGNKS